MILKIYVLIYMRIQKQVTMSLRLVNIFVIYYINIILKLDKNFLDIENAFIAKKGIGHPKICYLCEYDAIKDEGHITGHNLVTTMSVSAALALGNVIDKLGGSVILIGCPGEYLGGTKGTMVKQGVFDDIDVVMLAHPDISTCESGSSSAIIPLGLKFESENKLTFLNKKSLYFFRCSFINS